MGLSNKFAGDVSDATGTPSIRYLASDGEMVQGLFNPIRKYGFMSPVPAGFTAVTESDGTYNFAQELRATIYDETNNIAFLAEDNDQIFDSIAGATSGLVSRLGGIIAAAAGTHITDMEIYQINGVKNLFVSYMKTGGGDIMRSSIVANPNSFSSNATWLSGTVAGAITTGATNDVFMRTSDNGYMYIFDGASIHKLDGTTATGGANGTLTSNVIVFPFGFNITDAVDFKGSLYCAIQTATPNGDTAFEDNSYPSRVCGVYVWDRQSAVTSSVDFIPMSGVKDIRRLYVTNEGELRAIVVSSQRRTQIRRYNGSTFDLVAELGTQSFPLYRDSVGFMGDMVVWIGYDGKIYAHGKLIPLSLYHVMGTPMVMDQLYPIGDMTTEVGASGTYGAILVVDNDGSATTPRDGILIGAKANGGTIKNRYFYPNSTGTAPMAGNAITPVKMLRKLSTLNYINIFCAPTVGTGSTQIAQVKVYTNMSSTALLTFSVTKDMASRGYVTIPVAKPFCNAVQLEIIWDTSTTIGTDDFFPATAEIDYTPTETYA